jgi:hypothetical protein
MAMPLVRHVGHAQAAPQGMGHEQTGEVAAEDGEHADVEQIAAQGAMPALRQQLGGIVFHEYWSWS